MRYTILNKNAFEDRYKKNNIPCRGNPCSYKWLAGLFVIAIALLIVTSCGKKTSPPSVAAPGQTGVIATFPWEGARLIPLNSPIVINFSNPLSHNSNGAKASLVSLTGEAIPGELSIQSSYLFFTPSTSLAPLSYYRFSLSGTLYDENNEQVFLPAQGLTFSFETEGQYAPLVDVHPTLINIFPALDGPIFTNVVFRLTFSQPLSQPINSEGIKLFDATSNTLVPVKLLPINNNVVIQPVSDLTAGQTYTLTITDKLTGVNGLPITASGMNNGRVSYTFKPLPTGKQTDLTVYLDPSVQLDSNGNIVNMNNVDATGIPMNANIVSSKVVGTSIAYLTGYLLTIMGDANVNPALNPIVIPAGQRLYGSSLAINLGGVIPTGLVSKKLAITLLDNASVFMAGNAYQNINPQAPPAMYAIEDINMTAQDPITNAALNQNLMGVQLTGTVTVDKTDGSLIINFMGVTELGVMGIEKAPVILFLRFRSVPVGWVAPQRDNTFVATGTIPYNGDDRIGTDSGFIVNFSGPVDPDNFMNMFSLSPTGSTIGYQTIYNGSSVIITPYNLLNPLWPVPLSPLTTYDITVSAGLGSIMGTSLNQNAVFSFTTDAKEYGATTAGTYVTPVIATVFPEDGGILPLFTHPYISLNKFIDPTTVAYNQDVFVTDTTAGVQVTGGVVVTGKKIQFIPSQPLISGDQYTFAISHAIKDIDGYTLTQDTAIHFTAEATPWFPILSQELSPVADRNQDAFIDGNEVTTPTNTIVMGMATTTTNINIPIFCAAPVTATVYPKNPAYLSGAFNALVTGITVDTYGNPQMQFVVDDGARQFGTNVTITGVVWCGVLGPQKQTNITGRLTLALQPLTPTAAQGWPCGTRPACGYLAYDTSAQQLTAVTYMATTTSASDPTTEQMLSSHQPTKVVLSGPASFLPDGRLALSLSGSTIMTSDLISTNPLITGKVGTVQIPTTIYTRIVSTIPSVWN